MFPTRVCLRASSRALSLSLSLSLSHTHTQLLASSCPMRGIEHASCQYIEHCHDVLDVFRFCAGNLQNLQISGHVPGNSKCQKRPIYMVKETYLYGKRGLLLLQVSRHVLDGVYVYQQMPRASKHVRAHPSILLLFVIIVCCGCKSPGVTKQVRVTHKFPRVFFWFWVFFVFLCGEFTEIADLWAFLGQFYVSKETYSYGKRDLFIWQKRPIYMAKETC